MSDQPPTAIDPKIVFPQDGLYVMRNWVPSCWVLRLVCIATEQQGRTITEDGQEFGELLDEFCLSFDSTDFLEAMWIPWTRDQRPIENAL